jgi:hypothetical protein
MERRQGKTFEIVEMEEAILFMMTIAFRSLSYLFFGLMTITYRDVREGIFPGKCVGVRGGALSVI